MGIFLPKPVPTHDAASIVDRKLSWVLSACRPEEVWLFGSAATGGMTEASDIDLALLFKRGSEIREAQSKLAAIPRLDNWPQDIVWFRFEDFYKQAAIGGLPMIIVQEGKRLHPHP